MKKRVFLRLVSLSWLLITSFSLTVKASLEQTALAEKVDITLLHINDVYEITPVLRGKAVG